MASFDYDVVIIGSGFGGSVTTIGGVLDSTDEAGKEYRMG